MTTKIAFGRGASATETVIVSKCGKDQEIVLVAERHIEARAGCGDLHVRRDHRFGMSNGFALSTGSSRRRLARALG
jgi:hypothetical protein